MRAKQALLSKVVFFSLVKLSFGCAPRNFNSNPKSREIASQASVQDDHSNSMDSWIHMEWGGANYGDETAEWNYEDGDSKRRFQSRDVDGKYSVLTATIESFKTKGLKHLHFVLNDISETGVTQALDYLCKKTDKTKIPGSEPKDMETRLYRIDGSLFDPNLVIPASHSSRFNNPAPSLFSLDRAKQTQGVTEGSVSKRLKDLSTRSLSGFEIATYYHHEISKFLREMGLGIEHTGGAGYAYRYPSGSLETEKGTQQARIAAVYRITTSVGERSTKTTEPNVRNSVGQENEIKNQLEILRRLKPSRAVSLGNVSAFDCKSSPK